MFTHVLAIASFAISLVVAGSAAALEATARSYTIQPVPPPDFRNSYVPPQGAIFVIDNLRGTIFLCYPDSPDGKYLVTCTTQTALPN